MNLDASQPAYSLSSSSESTLSNQDDHRLQTRLDRQTALANLGQTALEISNLSQLLQAVLDTSAKLIQSDFSSVYERQATGHLLLQAGLGWPEAYIGTVQLAPDYHSQAGYTLLRYEPVVATGLSHEQRFTPAPIIREMGIESAMTVIIPGKQAPYGVFGVYARRKAAFGQEDVQFLQSMANLLASAMERMRTEQALLSSRQQLEVIFQGVADGISVQDAQGRIVYYNQAAARLLGILPPQVEADGSFATPIDPASILSKFTMLDDNGQPFPPEKLPGRLALQGHLEPAATIRFRRENGEDQWSLVKARPLLNAAGQAEMAVSIFQNVTVLKRRELSQRFLAEAGELLAASLDYEITLPRVAELLVPRLADWCAVHILEEDQSIRLLAVAHTNPQKVELARTFQVRYPPDPNATTGVAQVLRTGQPEFYFEITDAMLEASARDAEHLQVSRELGLKSAMIVPLLAHGRTLGAISLIWAESNHRYTQEDIDLAQELARRAALAIDNARLFQQAQTLNTELEERVNRRTAQLQEIVTRLHNEVSERQKAEEALRDNEKVLQSLFESAPDAMVLLDSEGQIVRLSAQAEIMFGYAKEELCGQNVDVLLPYRFRKIRTFSRVSTTTLRPTGAGLELYGQRKDGGEFPIDIMLNPVETDSGRLIIAAIRDISLRKQIEAELNEVQRRLIESIEAERLHLAQELHDGPMQDLYGMFYQLSALNSDPDALPPELNNELESFKQTVQHVNDVLRSMCGELRPPALAPFGLEKAIRAHLELIAEKRGELRPYMQLMPDGQTLPERTRLALFRIYQHALSNVLRHAEATEVHVRLNLDEDMVTLEIEDNGRGFELPGRWVDLARQGHLGLVGTAERVQAISGQLNIHSAPGKGTLVQVIAPIRGAPNSGQFAALPNILAS